MKKWPAYIFLLLMVACVSEDIPDHIIPQEEMAVILLDVYTAEAKLNNSRKKVDTEIYYPIFFQEILDKYNLTDSVYKVNLSYYMNHPIKFDEIYDIMIDSVKLRQQLNSMPDTTQNINAKPNSLIKK